MSDKSLQPDFDDELLSAYLDDELPDEERALVENRLATDPAARHLLDQLRHVSQSVHDLPPQKPARDLRESVLRRAEGTKHTAEQPKSVVAPGAIPKFTIGRTRRGWLWASLAVAAGLLIMFVERDQLESVDRDVALHRREAPSFTAAPNATPPASRQPGVRGLAATESPAAPTTSGNVSSPVHMESSEGIATAAPFDMVSEIDEDQLVVVHVLAKREALENRSFDRLLVSNGIAVEPQTPAENSPARIDRFRSMSRSSRASEGSAVQPTDSDANVEVVLVDAPPMKIFSCVADLNRDHANYLSVSVEESLLEDKAIAPQASAVPKKQLAADLEKYNRGVVPQLQKELLTRNKAYFYATPTDDYSNGGTGGALEAAGGVQQDTVQTFAAKSDSNQGRAQRVQLSNDEDLRSGELRKLGPRSSMTKAEETDNLQVLFVLAPGDELPASPATENRAE